MKVIGRKLYITIENDEWLSAEFGQQRERSRAVDLAIRNLRLKIDKNRSALTVDHVDLDLLDTAALGTKKRS